MSSTSKKSLPNEKGHQPGCFTPLMAFWNLVPAGLQAGPATMTSRIIMPTGIAMAKGRTGRPVKAWDIEETKIRVYLTSFPNASGFLYKFYLWVD
jgi:hypothetical protein